MLESVRELLGRLQSPVRDVAQVTPGGRGWLRRGHPPLVVHVGLVAATQMEDAELGPVSVSEKDVDKTAHKVRLDLVKCEVFVCLKGPLGAHLKQEVREKIWKGEYVEIFSLLPLEIFYLDRVKPDESKREEEEGRQRYRLKPRTFTNWLQAFTILASVIGGKAAENCLAL